MNRLTFSHESSFGQGPNAFRIANAGPSGRRADSQIAKMLGGIVLIFLLAINQTIAFDSSTTLASQIEYQNGPIFEDEILLKGEMLQTIYLDRYQEVLNKYNHIESNQSDFSDNPIDHQTSIKKWAEAVEKLGAHLVASRAIRYISKNSKGEKITLSGRVFLPGFWCNRLKPTSMILYSHGTETRRLSVPSMLTGVEDVIGAVATFFTCNIVVMPDLPGLGVDPAFHPYVHAKSLAYSMLDIIPAVEELLSAHYKKSIKWNHKFAIIGYSEGGYTSLATVHEVQSNPEYHHLKKSLVAGAAMAGPFSISRVMYQLMVGDKPSKHPVYLPYTIGGYQSVYGNIFDFDRVFKKKLLEQVVNEGGVNEGGLKEWFAGNYDTSKINRLIAKRMEVTPGRVFTREMMNKTFMQEEGPHYAATLKLLQENDLDQGWAPEKPILLWSSPDDDAVPYQNSLDAYTYLGSASRENFPEKGDLVSLVTFGKPGKSIGHAEAAIFAFIEGFSWIKAKLLSENLPISRGN